MAIFANGQSYQKYTGVGTAPTPIYYTRGQGGTAIGSVITVRNPTIVNGGTVTLYIGGGTIATALGTATAAQLLGAGVALPAGAQLVIFGTAVTQTATYFGNGTFDLYGCVAGSGTTVLVEGGYATQTIVS
jgi:hypothetical protein